MRNFGMRFDFNRRDWVLGFNWEVTHCPGHEDITHNTMHVAIFFFPMCMLVLEWDYGYRPRPAGLPHDFTIVLPGEFQIAKPPVDLDPKSGKF